jgi:hypothetical protein
MSTWQTMDMAIGGTCDRGWSRHRDLWDWDKLATVANRGSRPTTSSNTVVVEPYAILYCAVVSLRASELLLLETRFSLATDYTRLAHHWQKKDTAEVQNRTLLAIFSQLVDVTHRMRKPGSSARCSALRGRASWYKPIVFKAKLKATSETATS